MKIQGPGPPTKPPDAEPNPVESTEKASGFAPLAEGEQAGAKQGVEASERPTAPEAVRPDSVLPPEAISEIAAKVRAGEISRTQAFELIVDKVLEQQLSPDAPARVKEAVRARLEEVLEADPHLARQMDSLMREGAK